MEKLMKETIEVLLRRIKQPTIDSENSLHNSQAILNLVCAEVEIERLQLHKQQLELQKTIANRNVPPKPDWYQENPGEPPKKAEPVDLSVPLPFHTP